MYADRNGMVFHESFLRKSKDIDKGPQDALRRASMILCLGGFRRDRGIA